MRRERDNSVEGSSQNFMCLELLENSSSQKRARTLRGSAGPCSHGYHANQRMDTCRYPLGASQQKLSPKKMLTSPCLCWQFVNIVNKFRTPLLLLCVFPDVLSHGEIRNEDLVSVLHSIDGLTSEGIAIRARDKQHHCRRLATQATSGKHFCRQFAYFGQSTFATSKA